MHNNYSAKEHSPHPRTGPDIFEYMDYRKFLGDFFEHKKSVNKHFSHRLFARKAGLTSCGYFSEVVGGARNISRNKVGNFALGLELGEREKVYLKRLVAFNHAKTSQAKQALYESLVKAMPIKAQQLRMGQMEYFSKWYYVAVREALVICEVGDAYEELASRRDESSPLHVRAFQGEMIAKARQALETIPQPHRDISAVTMSISGEGMERLKGAIAGFRKVVPEIVQSDKGEDRVVQLNVQVFPLTRIEETHAPS
jgi:hypothetical protein